MEATMDISKKQNVENCHDHSQEHSHEPSQEYSQGHIQEHIQEYSQGHSQEYIQKSTQEDTHQHTHPDTHSDTHQHTHQHSHQNTKAVINRLSRAIGHLESVKKMVEDGRDCSDVLIQLAAVRSAINNTGKVILKDHIQNCIVEAIEEKDWEKIEKMNKAIDQFIK